MSSGNGPISQNRTFSLTFKTLEELYRISEKTGKAQNFIVEKSLHLIMPLLEKGEDELMTRLERLCDSATQGQNAELEAKIKK
jgi:hypothetical protein